MPAPTPIQIRYGGDPAALGGLALATGTARRRYADYQSQLASDRSFLQNELSRRTEDTRFRNNFNLSLLGMQANERAARAQATALQEASGYTQRQAAQAGGVTAPGQVGQPISLVPAEGPIDGTQPGGGGYIDFYDRDDPDGPVQRFFSEDGKLTRFGGGELGRGERGGFVGPGPQERMVTEETRSALDQMQLLKGRLSPDVWEPLNNMLLNGSLDPKDLGKALAQVKATQTGGSQFDPGKLPVRRARTARFEMEKIENISDPAVRERGMLEQLGYRPGSMEANWAKSRLDELWYQEWIEVDNMIGGSGSAGMLGSSRDNPVTVDQPGEEDVLPPGTWFRVPDGRVFRR